MESLSGHKDANNIVAEVMMERTNFSGALMVVEGASDCRFWKPRIADGACRLINAEGKITLLNAFPQIANKRIKGIFGVYDDDYDSLEGIAPSLEDLCTHDEHDLEAMLLKSNALDRVLGERGDQNKIEAFEKNSGCTVRDAIIKRSLLFGQLRWIAKKNNWEVPFKKKGAVYRFIPADTWELNNEGLINWFVNYCDGLKVADVGNFIGRLPQADPWLIIQGHDAVDVLAIGLKKILANNKGAGHDQLCCDLRMAFDHDYLRATNVFRTIKTWETANSPYKVSRA